MGNGPSRQGTWHTRLLDFKQSELRTILEAAFLPCYATVLNRDLMEQRAEATDIRTDMFDLTCSLCACNEEYYTRRRLLQIMRNSEENSIVSGMNVTCCLPFAICQHRREINFLNRDLLIRGKLLEFLNKVATEGFQYSSQMSGKALREVPPAVAVYLAAFGNEAAAVGQLVAQEAVNFATSKKSAKEVQKELPNMLMSLVTTHYGQKSGTLVDIITAVAMEPHSGDAKVALSAQITQTSICIAQHVVKTQGRVTSVPATVGPPQITLNIDNSGGSSAYNPPAMNPNYG